MTESGCSPRSVRAANSCPTTQQTVRDMYVVVGLDLMVVCSCWMLLVSVNVSVGGRRDCFKKHMANCEALHVHTLTYLDIIFTQKGTINQTLGPNYAICMLYSHSTHYIPTIPTIYPLYAHYIPTTWYTHYISILFRTRLQRRNFDRSNSRTCKGQ